MPIEPVDNPYRVIQTNKTRNVRRVERREPDEHQEKHEQTQEETPKELGEETQENKTSETLAINEKIVETPEDPEKPIIDITV